MRGAKDEGKKQMWLVGSNGEQKKANGGGKKKGGEKKKDPEGHENIPPNPTLKNMSPIRRTLEKHSARQDAGATGGTRDVTAARS